MSRTGTLLVYKLRFFFGPSLRGRFGPLPFVGLTLLLALYGYGFGVGLTEALRGSTPAQAVEFLSTPLATLLSLGLIYSLGSGVTAHVSELDFFLTSNVRPREYLVADLLFQFASLVGSGGLAGAVAAIGMVVGLGRPLWTVVPLFSLLVGYVLFILLVIQVLVILRVRYPRAPVRAATVALLGLSLVPAVSLVLPALGIAYASLPVPASAVGSLGHSILMGAPVDLGAAAVAVLELGALAGVWALLSGTYIFHGIRPSLSAGFGQIDMAARMDQQRRIIGGLGGLTTRIRLRTDRGSDTGLMARFHLIRIWRDGSVLFVILFAGISVLSATATADESPTSMSIGVTQLLTLLPAVLAINWSYYERDNLWIALQGRHSPSAYFRGLLVALAAVASVVAAAFLLLVMTLSGGFLSLEDLALPVGAPLASSVAAAALVTRLRIKPSAFSPGMLALLFLVVVAGFLGGFAGQGLLVAVRLLAPAVEGFQAILLVVYLAGLAIAGNAAVSRLGASFRL